MQSYDKSLKLVQSVPVEAVHLEDMLRKIESAEQKGAVKHVIGKLPVKGQTVEINGLQFKVDFADYVKGKFRVKMTIKGPKQ